MTVQTKCSNGHLRNCNLSIMAYTYMKSLRELFRIGKGPSSSHTMGPDNAARIYAKRHPEAKSFEVTLYGSLAATGKGHMTDVAIIDVLSNGRRDR